MALPPRGLGATESSRSTLVKRSTWRGRRRWHEHIGDEQRGGHDEEQRGATRNEGHGVVPHGREASCGQVIAARSAGRAAQARAARSRTGVSVSQSPVGGQVQVLRAGGRDRWSDVTVALGRGRA